MRPDPAHARSSNSVGKVLSTPVPELRPSIPATQLGTFKQKPRDTAVSTIPPSATSPPHKTPQLPVSNMEVDQLPVASASGERLMQSAEPHQQ